jgi:hypothetical protein
MYHAGAWYRRDQRGRGKARALGGPAGQLRRESAGGYGREILLAVGDFSAVNVQQADLGISHTVSISLHSQNPELERRH